VLLCSLEFIVYCPMQANIQNFYDIGTPNNYIKSI